MPWQSPSGGFGGAGGAGPSDVECILAFVRCRRVRGARMNSPACGPSGFWRPCRPLCDSCVPG